MPKFKINGGHINERDVEADTFDEEGSFIMFRDEDGVQVFALPTLTVLSIEQVPA